MAVVDGRAEASLCVHAVRRTRLWTPLDRSNFTPVHLCPTSIIKLHQTTWSGANMVGTGSTESRHVDRRAARGDAGVATLAGVLALHVRAVLPDHVGPWRVDAVIEVAVAGVGALVAALARGRRAAGDGLRRRPRRRCELARRRAAGPPVRAAGRAARRSCSRSGPGSGSAWRRARRRPPRNRRRRDDRRGRRRRPRLGGDHVRRTAVAPGDPATVAARAVAGARTPTAATASRPLPPAPAAPPPVTPPRSTGARRGRQPHGRGRRRRRQPLVDRGAPPPARRHRRARSPPRGRTGTTRTPASSVPTPA